MDPALAERKGRKRKAPAPPNPFTGEIENADSSNPFDDDDDKDDSMAIDTEEVNLFPQYYNKFGDFNADRSNVSHRIQVVFTRIISINQFT